MKTVIITLFFCFWSLILFSQDSYVAEMRRAKTPVPGGASYVSSQKKTDYSPAPSQPESFIQSYSTSAPNSSYVQSMKSVPPKVSKVSFPELMSLIQKRTTPVKPKKVSRVVIVCQPVKKVWKKVFSSQKVSDVQDFDPADFEDIAKWAKKEGKTFQAKMVSEKYGTIIASLAVEFGVDQKIIIALCAHESGGDPNAVSYAGASGLMQLMPSTAASYGVYGYDIFDPYLNLRAGTAYYADMLKLFGNTKDAIYAYGCGHYKARCRIDQGIKTEENLGVRQVLYLAQVQ